jgi:hypothetical protein
MHGTVTYEIGSKVRCADADCGELVQVVVDPIARRLAHLVVLPDGAGAPRLVPVELARPIESGIRLACTKAAFEALEAAVQTHFVSAAEGQEFGYPRDRVASWPFFGLAPGGTGGLTAYPPGPIPGPKIEVESRIPADEVGIRRGEPVHAADGDIGHVRGLIVDPVDEGVTHVLLDEGHLWARKQVAIPIGAVSVIGGGGVKVHLTKDQIKDLPPVDFAG